MKRHLNSAWVRNLGTQGLAVLALAFFAGALAAAPAGAAPPTVEIDPSPVGSYGRAQLSGTVDPGGNETYYLFESSTDEVNWVPGGVSLLAGDAGPTGVSQELKGLQGATKYFFRLVAYNFVGDPVAYTPAPYPFATILAVDSPTVLKANNAADVGFTTAKVSGEIERPANPDAAFDTNCRFEYVTDAQFDANGFQDAPQLPCGIDSLTASEEREAVEAELTDLQPATEYHLRLTATNVGLNATLEAADTFTTLAVAPRIEAVPPFALGNGTEALLGGKVNPENSASKYWFEYGPGPAGPGATYTDVVPASKDASAGSGGQAVMVARRIAGLAPGSEYHFRLVAESVGGKSKGEDVGFETASLPSFPADCPNAALRAETNSLALPGCRAYEMTTAPDKIGGDATPLITSSPDGDRVAFLSATGFGDSRGNSSVNAFMAQRGPSGWTTRSMQPAIGSRSLSLAGAYVASDFNSDVSKALLIARSGAAEPAIQNLFVTSDDGSTRWITAPTLSGEPIVDKYYVGRSADASRLVFESSQKFTEESPGGNAIWQWAGGAVRFVGTGHVGTGTDADRAVVTGFSGSLVDSTAVSADGRRIFFTDGYAGLYAYEEGAPTRGVSLSQRTGSVGQYPASPVGFVAAARDGSRVYMQSEDQLTDDATLGGGLYYYDLETDLLHFASRGATDPSGAQFLAASLISADGKRAYFIARGQLDPGEGTIGAPNLYVADDDGVELIATLSEAPGDAKKGTTQATPDGGHFVFDSTERLTAFDNEGQREVYLYGVDDESLRCVSCAPDGEAAGGEAAVISFHGEAVFSRSRVISSNGAQVFFQTTAALAPADVNGMLDVYEYQAGSVSLISSGTSKYDSEIADNSPAGTDIFFTTRDSLVGQDIDNGSTDIYDARVQGGFPAPLVREPCEGEGCQGKATPPPPIAQPTTGVPRGKGNIHRRAKRKAHRACKGKAKKQRRKCGSKSKEEAGEHQPKRVSKNGRSE